MIPDGFTTEVDLAWLAQAAEMHSAIVEIGCWAGRSTSALLKTPGFVLCVDDWAGSRHGFLPTDIGEMPADGGLSAFIQNMTPYMGKVIPIKMRSQEAAKLFPAPCFDMVFIDGDHRYESVYVDISRWMDRLKSGGLLCGHNYEDCWKDDVVRAVDELVPDRQLVPNSSIWWKVI